MNDHSISYSGRSPILIDDSFDEVDLSDNLSSTEHKTEEVAKAAIAQNKTEQPCQLEPTRQSKPLKGKKFVALGFKAAAFFSCLGWKKVSSSIVNFFQKKYSQSASEKIEQTKQRALQDLLVVGVGDPIALSKKLDRLRQQIDKQQLPGLKRDDYRAIVRQVISRCLKKEEDDITYNDGASVSSLSAAEMLESRLDLPLSDSLYDLANDTNFLQGDEGGQNKFVQELESSSQPFFIDFRQVLNKEEVSFDLITEENIRKGINHFEQQRGVSNEDSLIANLQNFKHRASLLLLTREGCRIALQSK
jgi:hypothetical protein